MSDYNLVDIHFHSDLSYDAYKNNCDKFDDFDLHKIFSNSNVKMVCFTDHNIFNYESFCTNRNELEKIKIVSLPGAELTIDGIHWIFIFDDKRLDSEVIGQKFSEDFFEMINKKTDEFDLSGLEEKNFKADEIIRLLNKYEINFIAIPHLDKKKGIFKNGTVSETRLKMFANYIHNNIVYGFETKEHDEFFVNRIDKINKNISLLLEENAEQSKIDKLIEQIEKTNHVKEISSAFVYGSDYHGDGEKKYKDYESDLFYIKSECTFEGIRLALLDHESRIYSEKRLKKYDKKTNKILEYIRFADEKNNEDFLRFGDGLNSIIGSRGTGKSYIIKSILSKASNYSGSEISTQIKVIGVKLKGEEEKKSLVAGIDADSIFQKNSSSPNSENIYDLLAEAPYDIKKFVSKIRELSSESSSENNVDDFFEIANNCIRNFIEIENEKNNTLDYSLLKKYNDFYKSVGLEYKVSEIFDGYGSFGNQILLRYESENKTIIEFDREIEAVEKRIEMLKAVKDYTYKDFTVFLEEITKIKSANKLKLQKNSKNKDRIEKTINLAKTIISTITANSSNEQRNYTSTFDSISSKIDVLLEKMRTSKEEVDLLKKVNNKVVRNEESIKINKNDGEISLLVSSEFDPGKVEIRNLNDIFGNYKNTDSKNQTFNYLFEDSYGKNYIETIYKEKDQRYTKGLLNGYELLVPKLSSNISININDDLYDLSKLSPGQKSDILLDLVLEKNTNKILIIDQPEDDLDNETIQKKVVQKIRSLKLRRQIIIVSHNANLVINGDSDRLIACCKKDDKYSFIQDTMESTNFHEYSSINSQTIEETALNIAVQILEGGRLALAQRVKKIGYKDIFFKEMI